MLCCACRFTFFCAHDCEDCEIALLGCAMEEQAVASSVHCCEVEESVAVPEAAKKYEIKERYVGRKSKPYCVGLGKAYAKMFALAVGFFLVDIPFFLLSSLTTSFSVDLGAFSLGAMYVAFTSFLFVAPSLVVMLGSKTCAVGSGFGALVFSLGYLYPSWYTLLPGSFVMGVSLASVYTIIAVTKNDEVQNIAEKYNIDPVTYQGRFSAIISVVGDGASSVVSGIVTFVILSSNPSYPNPLDSVHSNQSFANLTVPPACVTVTGEAPAIPLDSLSYYILVAVCAGASTVCIFILSILDGAAYHKCRLRSYGPKEFVCHVASYVVKVLQQGSTPEYALLLPLRLTHGFALGFFQGVFTKVSEI